jgi:hypothetical protein
MKAKIALLCALLLILSGVLYWRWAKYQRYLELGMMHASSADAGTPIIAEQVLDGDPKTAKLSFESRLFRSTMLGRAYGLSIADFRADRIPKDISYLSTQLFSAAATALRVPNCCYPDSAANLRKLLLNAVEPTLLSTPADLPPMKTDDLMLIHVYAMVSAGQDQLLMAILQEALKSKERFVRVFAVNALRAYGGPEAMQLMSNLRQDDQVGAIANIALALDWSNFYLPRAFAGELPYAKRTRQHILKQASDDALQTGTILPTMMMGFLAEDAPQKQLQAELDYLKALNFAPNGFLMYRHGYAVSALAFRKAADFDYWRRAYLANNLPVARIPMIRAMVLLDPGKFMAFAPEIIDAGAGGWDSYEFMLAYTALANGNQPYSYYDLFFTPPNQYRLRYPFQKNAFAKISPEPVLARWADGVWMYAKDCPSCDISWITSAVPKALEPLLIQGFIAAPKRDYASYGLLARALTDTRGKSVLKFLLDQESDPQIIEQRKFLLSMMDSEKVSDPPCCERTQACLEAQVKASLEKPEIVAEAVVFKSRQELSAYLSKWRAESEPESAPESATLPAESAITIDFDRANGQSAQVQIGADKSQWTHWLGCWRKD